MTTTAQTKTRTAKAAAQAVNGSAHSAEQIHTARMAQINDEYMASKGVATPVRQIVAAVAQLATFSASIYWGCQAAGFLMTAAIVYTGSGFLAFVIGFMAMFLAIKASWSACCEVARGVIEFNVDDASNIGRDLRVAAAKKVSLVKGWFKREDRIEVAA